MGAVPSEGVGVSRAGYDCDAPRPSKVDTRREVDGVVVDTLFSFPNTGFKVILPSTLYGLRNQIPYVTMAHATYEQVVTSSSEIG